MTGISHATIGGAAGAAAGVVTAVGWPWFITAVLIGMVSGLLPDLDSTDSLARTRLGLGKEQINREWSKRVSFSLIVRWVISWPLNILARLLPHRGPTHWLITAVLITSAAYTVTNWAGWPAVVWLAVGGGYLSHLLADGLTIAGVPLLGPLTRRAFRFVPRPLALRTGGAAEFMVVGAGLAMVGMVWVWL